MEQPRQTDPHLVELINTILQNEELPYRVVILRELRKMTPAEFIKEYPPLYGSEKRPGLLARAWKWLTRDIL